MRNNRMKVRTDFVTNSSSSSFIVAFKDEDSIITDLKDAHIGRHFDRILRDIKKYRITKGRALYDFVNEMFWYNMYIIHGKYVQKLGNKLINQWNNREAYELDAFNKTIDQLKEFKEQIDEYDYISKIEYFDDCESEEELECSIMPNLKNTLVKFNHH